MSRLDLVVGPNGAGRSTFERLVIRPAWPTADFVNADAIAAERWPDDAERHAHEAAAIATATRSRLIELGRPFVTETAFSHESKLALVDEAAAAGYYVALHVLMVPADLAVARVASRHAQGGHHVPVDRIRRRYQRLWGLVAVAVAKVDSATFWDNSTYDGPREVGQFVSGLAVGPAHWPRWAPAEVTSLPPAVSGLP